MKINQFPGLFIIGRKDNLWLIFEKMREKYGPEEFDFCPTTYILPRQRDQLVRSKSSIEVTTCRSSNILVWFGRDATEKGVAGLTESLISSRVKYERPNSWA